MNGESYRLASSTALKRRRSRSRHLTTTGPDGPARHGKRQLCGKRAGNDAHPHKLAWFCTAAMADFCTAVDSGPIEIAASRRHFLPRSRPSQRPRPPQRNATLREKTWPSFEPERVRSILPKYTDTSATNDRRICPRDPASGECKDLPHSHRAGRSSALGLRLSLLQANPERPGGRRYSAPSS